MERNYDEIIAEMLLQIDRHTEELAAIRKEQEAFGRQQAEINRQQAEINKSFLSRLDGLGSALDMVVNRLDKMGDSLDEGRHAQNKINENLVNQIVHTAEILDRIIKKNGLQV